MNLGALAGGVAAGYKAGQSMNLDRDRLKLQQEEAASSRDFRDRQMKMSEQEQGWKAATQEREAAMQKDAADTYNKYYGPKQVEDGVESVMDPATGVAAQKTKFKTVQRTMGQDPIHDLNYRVDMGAQLIQRDPARLRIALSHEWGAYSATPHFIDELTRIGRLLEGLGHQVDWALPAVDFEAAFAAQTTCYISNFAQTIANMLAARGLAEPPPALIEPINIRIWQAGIGTSFSERAQMQAVFNTTARGFGAFFEDWDIILTPITALPTPRIGTTAYLTTSSNPSVLDWFHNLWKSFAYTPLSNLCGIPGLSLPLGVQESGLPLGLHFQARQAHDGLLLQLAAQIERALGGRWNGGRLPAHHVTRT